MASFQLETIKMCMFHVCPSSVHNPAFAYIMGRRRRRLGGKDLQWNSRNKCGR
jgi:hypothetical protein